MTDKTNRTVTVSEEPITIPAAQFARILTAAIYADYLRDNRTKCETRIANMRSELRHYQTICENHKKASGAGASKEPQQNTTNADETKTDAGALAIETEGRVSGGDRAELQDRLAAAERCIESIEHMLYGGEDYATVVTTTRNIIRAWRDKRGRKSECPNGRAE